MNKLEQIKKDVDYCESELKGKGFSGVHILIDDINALLHVVEAAMNLPGESFMDVGEGLWTCTICMGHVNRIDNIFKYDHKWPDCPVKLLQDALAALQKE